MDKRGDVLWVRARAMQVKNNEGKRLTRVFPSPWMPSPRACAFFFSSFLVVVTVCEGLCLRASSLLFVAVWERLRVARSSVPTPPCNLLFSCFPVCQPQSSKSALRARSPSPCAPRRPPPPPPLPLFASRPPPAPAARASASTPARRTAVKAACAPSFALPFRSRFFVFHLSG